MSRDPLERPNALVLLLRLLVGCAFGAVVAVVAAIAGAGFPVWLVPLCGVGFVLAGLLDRSA